MVRKTEVQIPGRVIPKTQKIVLDAALFSTQHYKMRIKGKVDNPGKGVAPPQHLSVVAIEKGAFASPSTKLANFTYYICLHIYVYIYVVYMNVYIYIYIYSKASKVGDRSRR